MQARYYDPVIGRFYSNDPVGALNHLKRGSVQGFNRYKYANNNPYKYVDPDGNMEVNILQEIEVFVKSFGYNSAEQGNANIGKDTNKIAVSGLRTSAKGADIISKGALAVAAGGAMTGQLQVAGPAAGVSTTAGITSAVLDGVADLIEMDGLSGETIESSAPMAVGALTENAMNAVNITSKISKPVAIAVEVVGTIAETAGDLVESHENRDN